MELTIFLITAIIILAIASMPAIKKEKPAKVAFKPMSKDFDDTRVVVDGIYENTKSWVREYGYGIFKYVDVKPDANEYTWNNVEGYHKRNDNERTYVNSKEISNYGVHNNLFVIPLVYIWKKCICLVHVVDGGGTLRYMNDNLVLATKTGEFMGYSQDFSADGHVDLQMFKNYAKTLGFSEDQIVEVFYGLSKRTDLSMIKNDYDCKVITAYNPKQLVTEMVRVNNQFDREISKENAANMANNFSDKHELSYFDGPVVYGNVHAKVVEGKVLLKQSIVDMDDEMGARCIGKEIRTKVTDREALKNMKGHYGTAKEVLASVKDVENYLNKSKTYLKKKNGAIKETEPKRINEVEPTYYNQEGLAEKYENPLLYDDRSGWEEMDFSEGYVNKSWPFINKMKEERANTEYILRLPIKEVRNTVLKKDMDEEYILSILRRHYMDKEIATMDEKDKKVLTKLWESIDYHLVDEKLYGELRREWDRIESEAAAREAEHKRRMETDEKYRNDYYAREWQKFAETHKDMMISKDVFMKSGGYTNLGFVKTYTVDDIRESKLK